MFMSLWPCKEDQHHRWEGKVTPDSKPSLSSKAFLGGSDGKESALGSVGDPASIPGLGSTLETEWQPIPVFCLENLRTEEPGGLHPRGPGPTGSQRVEHD